MYDLLSPHASQQRPLPLLTSARLATTAAGSNVVGYERDVEMHATASREDSPPSCSQREGWGVSRVKGLSVHAVDSATQVMELLRQGGRNRRVRSTEVRCLVVVCRIGSAFNILRGGDVCAGRPVLFESAPMRASTKSSFLSSLDPYLVV